MAKNELPNTCPVMRRVLVRRGTMSMATGESSALDAGTWETQPCGIPLFGRQKEVGKCRGCADGWEVPANRPATPEEIAATEGR